MAVNCSAVKCVHNDKDGNCYAQVIQVRGSHATSAEGTICHSFAREELSDAEFAQEFDAPLLQASTSNIKCGARRCKYQVNNKCKASDVSISGDEVDCETFQVRD